MFPFCDDGWLPRGCGGTLAGCVLALGKQGRSGWGVARPLRFLALVIGKKTQKPQLTWLTLVPHSKSLGPDPLITPLVYCKPCDLTLCVHVCAHLNVSKAHSKPIDNTLTKNRGTCCKLERNCCVPLKSKTVTLILTLLHTHTHRMVSHFYAAFCLMALCSTDCAFAAMLILPSKQGAILGSVTEVALACATAGVSKSVPRCTLAPEPLLGLVYVFSVPFSVPVWTDYPSSLWASSRHVSIKTGCMGSYIYEYLVQFDSLSAQRGFSLSETSDVSKCEPAVHSLALWEGVGGGCTGEYRLIHQCLFFAPYTFSILLLYSRTVSASVTDMLYIKWINSLDKQPPLSLCLAAGLVVNIHGNITRTRFWLIHLIHFGEGARRGHFLLRLMRITWLFFSPTQMYLSNIRWKMTLQPPCG